MRNLLMIVGAAMTFDLWIEPNAVEAVDEVYRRWVYHYAADPMIEPYVAVGSFLLSCVLFTATEYLIAPPSLPPALGRTVKTQKADPASTAKGPKFFEGSFAGWVLWAAGNIGIYLGFIAVFQYLSGYAERYYRVDPHWRLHSGLDREVGAPSWTATRIVLEVFLSVLLYDVLFSVIHRSFHSSTAPVSWQRLHLVHHDHYQRRDEPITIMVTFHHHLLDAMLQVGINAMLQQVVGLALCPEDVEICPLPLARHTMSKLLHNIVVTYLLVESHSGQDLPFMSHRWLFPDWLGGAPMHQRHHHTGRAPFHQFFTVFDEIAKDSA